MGFAFFLFWFCCFLKCTRRPPPDAMTFVLKRGCWIVGMWFLDKIWDDKRICTVVLLIWLVFVLVSFQSIDLLHADFMKIGPNDTAKILTVKIDTMHKWTLVALASFTSTIVSDFMADSISPWITNTIQVMVLDLF